MELLGKISNLKIPLDPLDVKEVNEDISYQTSWKPESSMPGWCTDTDGIVLGIDIDEKTRISYPPRVLPKIRFNKIQFMVEYINSDKVPTKFTLGFIGRKGKILERTIESTDHETGRVCFPISILDLSPDRLFRSRLIIEPKQTLDSKIYVCGAWLELVTEV